ncbi:Regulatory protein LuxO [Acaryochloris thomasi RCC1774]|uniref:Regulatory protein LuxO n=1 Tax=Acaryochloris thomasi RCC1774 TaxID=1764569 RepID=A0A2W1JUU4_9CYAN|nr:response regulator [Acaryochloris thomasi]PZD74252.1 Regulatory protein LuxO [Acaryochloris thomasi RCC1774]
MTTAPIMEPIKLLIIEDDTGDLELLEAYLEPMESEVIEVVVCQWLRDAKQQLESQRFDLILLDLSLPDSRGLDTFRKIQGFAPTVPVVILSGLSDQDLSLQAVRLGAQDYLTKDQVNSQILLRSIHYAVERHRLLLQAGQTERQTQNERDLYLLESLPTQQSTVTAMLYNSASLKASFPDEFQQMVQQYGRLMDLALEKRMFQLGSSLSDQLQAVAENLAFYQVGPRDVIEIHTAAVQTKTADSPSEKTTAYLEESRFLVLELMGYLVAYYRRYCVRVNQPKIKP